MERKKLILFLVIAFMAFVGCGTKFCFAAESKDSLKIKKTIENFLNGHTTRRLDLMMNEVSFNYLEKGEVEFTNYAKFMSKANSILTKIYSKYKEYIITEVVLSNLNIQTHAASVTLEFNWQGTEINTSRKITGKLKKFVNLEEEKGNWKIVQYRKAD